MADVPNWPAYQLGPKPHIHALGVIAINYNSVEHALFVLLRDYLGVSSVLHGYIFQSLTTNSAIELFKLAVEEHEKHPELHSGLMEFCRLFSICHANRNILMHANTREADATDDLLALAKRTKSKPHLFVDMQLTLPELHKVADDAHAVLTYAAGLWKFILYRRRQTPGIPDADQAFPLPALPDRPSLLVNLADIFQPTRTG